MIHVLEGIGVVLLGTAAACILVMVSFVLAVILNLFWRD